MSGLSEVEQWVQENWTFKCGEDPNDVFEQIEDDWNPDVRFSLTKVLGNDFPDFMVWIQEQIDDECEDITETITFPPERDESAKERQKEISDVKAELLKAKEELAELEEEADRTPRAGIIQGITRYTRNIFRG